MKDVKVTKPKKGEQNVIVYDLTLSSPDRNSKDISSLKSAILRAESITLPNRHLLYDLYHDVKSIDGHLSGICRKRIDAVLNKNLNFVNKEKQQVEELEALIESNKFNKLIELLLETKLWGCSGAEFIIGEKFDWVEVPRKHIRPEAGVIAKSQYSNTGIPIDDLPFVWVMGEKKDLGQLLQCSMYALYKRNGFGDYAQYVEIFGQPVRIIKYDANDTATKNELDKVLAESGSSLAMKIPRQADFEMLDGKASNANGDLQTKLISVCNSEMSIAILGNTETTTSSSSSGYAQSKEHGKQQLEITKSDLRYVQNMLNSEFFIQMLKSYGFPVEGGRFEYEMELDLDSLKTKLEIDDKVSSKVPVSDDYWYNTYGIPKPDNYDELKAEQKIKLEADAKAKAESMAQANQPPQPNPKEKDVKLKNKKKLAALLDLFFLDKISLNEFYAQTCGCSTHLHDLVDNASWNSIYESIARDLLANKLANGQIHPELYNQTANSLLEAVDAGLGGTSFNYDDSRNILKSYLTRNVYQFSAAKTLTEQLEFRNMMYNKKTKELLSYNEFLKLVKSKGKLFNENYLETEYSTAKQSAIMAHKWDSMNSDFLEFSTVGDDKVRADHRKLDGMTYPKNHQIWNKLYPPLEWNCRCTVIPGIASKHDDSNANEDEKLIGGMVKNTIFENNVGVSRVIFKNGHPYFTNVGSKVLRDLSWKSYGLQELAMSRARYGKVPAFKLDTPKEFEDFYDKMVNTKSGIVLKDVTGSSVLFPEDFKQHILSRKKDPLRYEFAGNAFEAVSKPSEVWSVVKKNDSRPLTTHYIKYYTNKTILVLAEDNVVKTAFVLDKTGFKTRMGVLLYKK